MDRNTRFSLQNLQQNYAKEIKIVDAGLEVSFKLKMCNINGMLVNNTFM